MLEYTKIETIFDRATDGSKKLIEGKFRNRTIEYLSSNLWVCTEKIDGTNIGVVWDGHNVSFQGRTANAQLPARLVNRLQELFSSNEAEELFEQKFGETEVILFGEGFGAGIQNGGNYLADRVDFILFDVYLPEKGIWLTRDSVDDIARTFGIRVVPVVKICTLKEAVQYVKTKPNSSIGTAKMEGVVCRPLFELTDRLGKRVIVKIKACDF